MSIFRAYDIRGVYPSDLNEEIAYNIGRAYILFLKNEAKKENKEIKTIIVGRDMRLSSDKIFESLSKGINDQGVNVIDIGLCTTPMTYFATAKYEVDGSIMITASHNPKEYNGLKLSRKMAIPIGADSGMYDIEALYDKHIKKGFPESETKGTVTKKEIKDDYVNHLKELIGGDNCIEGLKIVVDAANATGCLEYEHIKRLSDSNVEFIPLFMELDGTFPNHEPNPLKAENMQDLAKAVKENNADIGVAFDGDSDRAGFVDENGEIITSDFIIALLAREFLDTKKGEKILYDLRSSWATKEAIEEHGGIPIMCKVGHAFIKKQLRDEKAIFGGELAGHFYFKDNYYTDSGILAALKILKSLSKDKKQGVKISDVVKPLRKYFHSGEINSVVENADEILKELEEKYSDAKDVSHLDGLKVEYDNYWFNVRKSNTEPKLRLIVEARTKHVMDEKVKELLGIIRR